MNLLDKAINYLSPVRGARRQAARLALGLTADYRGADTSRLRSNWILGRSNTTPPSYTLEILRNRSRDLNRNDAVASGATETLGHNIIGRGLRPQSRLRAEVLNITDDQARELQRQAEYIWSSWTPFADSGNRLTFDDLQFLALRKIVEDGEILALPVMAGEPWRPLGRAVELLEADRLAQTGSNGSESSFDTGVELGKRGEPVAYWISRIDYQNQLSVSYNLGTPERITARDSRGRPRVLHIYRCQRPGQVRGIPYFAPVLTYFKDLADYLDAELVAAKVAACLAVFVTKVDPMSTALAAATSSEAGTGKRIQGIEPGLINYLNLGEDIRVVDPKRGGDTFQMFVENVLRMIGISLGLPYELLAKDFSKTNYSSARASLLEGRRMFTTWRSWFAGQFCQPIWELVLEEAFLRGLFDAPDFYNFKTEYTRALWIGGGWGWVDPVKEIEASKMAIDFGLSTFADEAAGQGRDWEETLDQRRREEEYIQEIGISIEKAVGGKAPAAGGP
jgi:lambda family phage portal protein